MRTFPLALGQEAFALLQTRLDHPITVPTFMRVTGPLDVGRLVVAVQALGRRHEALRANIGSEDGTLRQWARPVDQQLEPVLHRVAGARLASFDRTVAEVVAAEARQPLDVSRNWLTRAYLFEWRKDHHVLCILCSHLVCDGYSTQVLVNDLRALYATGGADLLGEPHSFFASAAAQRGATASQARHDEHIGFWIDQLTPQPRPAWRSNHPDDCDDAPTQPESFALDLCRRELQQAARGRGSGGGTSAAVVLWSWLHALSAHDPGRPTVVALPYAGRGPQTVDVVGSFAQVLNVRFDPMAQRDVRSVSRRLFRAYDAAAVPTLAVLREWERRGGGPTAQPTLYFDYTVERRDERPAQPEVDFTPWWPADYPDVARAPLGLEVLGGDAPRLRLWAEPAERYGPRGRRVIAAMAAVLGGAQRASA